MKFALVLAILFLSIGYAFAQKEKEKHFEIPYPNLELPQYREDDLFMQRSPASVFHDNIPVMVPKRNEMAKMPMMSIDSTTEFTILKKELYKPEDQYYKNKEPRFKFEGQPHHFGPFREKNNN